VASATSFSVDLAGFGTQSRTRMVAPGERAVTQPVTSPTSAGEIRLYPIELGWTEPRSQRGTPRIEQKALGRKSIERSAELSRRFGAEIEYEGEVGVWRR
jgi:hypothetical protein